MKLIIPLILIFANIIWAAELKTSDSISKSNEIIATNTEAEITSQEIAPDFGANFDPNCMPPEMAVLMGNGATLEVRVGPAKSQLQHWLDSTILLIMLLLGTLGLFVAKSRRWTVGLLFISLIYFGFWRKGCICPLGAIGNIVVALKSQVVGISIFTIIFFMLPLFFTIIVGRVFCGSVCPFGALQDILAVKTIKVPKKLDKLLRLGCYAVLGLIIYYALAKSLPVMCKYDPFIPIFRLTGHNQQWLLAMIIVILSVFIARPFCRWMCPYAVILKWLAKISFIQKKINVDSCIKCGKCQKVCPVNSIEVPHLDQSICIACNRCKDICPTKAIKN